MYSDDRTRSSIGYSVMQTHTNTRSRREEEVSVDCIREALQTIIITEDCRALDNIESIGESCLEAREEYRRVKTSPAVAHFAEAEHNNVQARKAKTS